MTSETALHEFEIALRSDFPNVKVAFDAPAAETGTWWVDLSIGDAAVAVSWREGFGFGVFSSEEGYGDKPDERYAEPGMAARRIRQMVMDTNFPGHGRPMWLREVRSLLGVPQNSLADDLHVNQAAISRLENRDDIKLSTLLAYFEALGGHVEMRVRFKEFEAEIARPAARYAEEV
jgi:hypothetical protein